MLVEKILVATDFSNCSKKAIKFAMLIGKDEKSEIYVVHAIDLIKEDNAVDAETAIKDADIHLMEDEVEQIIKELKENGNIHITKDNIHILEEHGKYEKVILEKAETIGIDLIVMGTHGANTIKEKLIGTTTEHVVKYAKCSVLCVKPDGYPIDRD